jgi:hypothetical protein
LLHLNSTASSAAAEASLFAGYIGRSWIAIARSKGILPSVSSPSPSLWHLLTINNIVDILVEQNSLLVPHNTRYIDAGVFILLTHVRS